MNEDEKCYEGVEDLMEFQPSSVFSAFSTGRKYRKSTFPQGTVNDDACGIIMRSTITLSVNRNRHQNCCVAAGVKPPPYSFCETTVSPITIIISANRSTLKHPSDTQHRAR